MAALIMAVIMGVIGGAGMAWVMTNPTSRKGHEVRRAKFSAGEGADPDRAPFGPHKSFKQNAITFGLMFAVLGFFIGTLG